MVDRELKRDIEISLNRAATNTARGSVAALQRAEIAASANIKSESIQAIVPKPQLAMNDDLSRVLDYQSVESALRFYLANIPANTQYNLERGTLLSLVA